MIDIYTGAHQIQEPISDIYIYEQPLRSERGGVGRDSLCLMSLSALGDKPVINQSKGN